MRVPKDILPRLLNESLFKNHLLKDMKIGHVFMALRRNSVDFYHAGRRLFMYSGSFATHREFIPLPTNKQYVTQEEAAAPVEGVDFAAQYTAIKKRCARYAGVESSGVSSLLQEGSYLQQGGANGVCCLDAEVSFSSRSSSEEDETSRIDVLLFNTQTRSLRFVEAKHYSNKELWTSPGRKPPVVRQIATYNALISAQAGRIVDDYKHYVDSLNEMLELGLPTPLTVEPECGLYIFGFDRDQLKGRFRRLLQEDESLGGIRHCPLGDPKGISASHLWQTLAKGHRHPRRRSPAGPAA